jgi:hypothetical protein
MTANNGHTKVVFEDLPPKGRKQTSTNVWHQRLWPLLSRPGEWARIHEFKSVQAASSMVFALRTRLSVPAGRWDFASRSVDGRHYLYARYWPADAVATMWPAPDMDKPL